VANQVARKFTFTTNATYSTHIIILRLWNVFYFSTTNTLSHYLVKSNKIKGRFSKFYRKNFLRGKNFHLFGLKGCKKSLNIVK
jgi:hypothetical protein